MSTSLTFRPPTPADGAQVNELIANSPPLDRNSLYCNLLQCSHFQDTCILAEDDQAALGFVSAYRLPQKPQTLFIWQIVVSDKARGQGLGSRLLQELLNSKACRGVTHIETTITETNQASRNLFRKLASHLKTEIAESEFFDRTTHFGDQHDSEPLLQLGPFTLSN